MSGTAMRTLSELVVESCLAHLNKGPKEDFPRTDDGVMLCFSFSWLGKVISRFSLPQQSHS